MGGAAGRIGLLLVLLAGLSGTQAMAAARLPARQPGLLRLAGHHVKWGVPRYGAPALVRWAFVAAPHAEPTARNCRQMLPPDRLAAALGTDMAGLEREFRAAFRIWSAVSGLRFRRAEAPEQADILIGVQAGDRGIAFADVAERRGLGGTVAPIRRAAVCLDASERWELEADGRDESYRLRYVAAHEIGHAVGLDHIGRTGSLMSFAYDPLNEAGIGLSAADRAAIVRLYGPPGGAGAATATVAMPTPPCLVPPGDGAARDCRGIAPAAHGR